MPQDTGQSIAQGLADTFSFKKQRQQLSDTIGKAKSALGMGGDSTSTSSPSSSSSSSTPPQTAFSVDDANKGFRDRAEKDAAKPAAKPAPKAKTTPIPKPKVNAPSYKHGTDYVPKTGAANLHKGEAVLKKKDADKYREAKSMKGYDVADELGGKKDEKPKKEIKHIVTKKAKNGGYIHEHHHTHPEHHPMEEHVSPNQDAMVSHMMDHMGEANPGEAEADAGQSGVPDTGAAAAAAQPAPQPQPAM